VTNIPENYRWPGSDAVANVTHCFWIVEYSKQATHVYTVIGTDGDGQHIIAEKCYLQWAIKIVDGLRAIT
jgi:hypothetical protein